MKKGGGNEHAAMWFFRPSYQASINYIHLL